MTFLTILSSIVANWRMILITAALVAAGVVWHQIDKAGYQRKAAEDAAAQVEVLQRRLGTLQLTQAADAQRAAADAYFNSKLEALSRDTPKNDGVCLDADAARRVRAIGGSNTRPAPVPAKRHSNVLQGRSGAP